MADMAAVNRVIRRQFPALDIEAVRGDGYVYFGGDDGFGVVASIYSNPPTTTTGAMIRMCVENIWRPVQEAIIGKRSTTDAYRPEYNEVYEVIHSRFADHHGVTLPMWPSKEKG